MGKNVFIIFAHPNPESLNGAVLNVTVEALQKQGHQVTVSDLCGMNFDPTVGIHDIAGYVIYKLFTVLFVYKNNTIWQI